MRQSMLFPCTFSTLPNGDSGQACGDGGGSDDGRECKASEDDCVREASEDGRTAFDLSIAIVMKSDAPLE